MKIPSTAAALALAVTLVGAACSDSDESAESTVEAAESTVEAAPADEAAESTVEAAPADEAAESTVEAGTIVEVAGDAGSFSTLLAAAEAAGLVETLSGDGPFTVFAPTDDAFTATLDELDLTAEELLASEDLAGILTYHVVPGTVLAADVIGLDGETVGTVNGAEVAITVDGDIVKVDRATVTATDVIASNGVIHVIDQVLLPTS